METGKLNECNTGHRKNSADNALPFGKLYQKIFRATANSPRQSNGQSVTVEIIECFIHDFVNYRTCIFDFRSCFYNQTRFSGTNLLIIGFVIANGVLKYSRL